VISDLLYKPTYDPQHRAIEMSATGNQRFLQTGYWEYMLCEACEQRLNKLETYFSNAWPMLPTNVAGLPLVFLQGLDYTRFKLFHLSILWRASVSTLRVFSHVALGPHAERIRRMLLTDDPGPEGVYPFIGQVLFDPSDGHVRNDMIMEPIPSKFNALRVYVFMFGGCAWYYYVASHDPGELAPVAARLKITGDMILGTHNAFSLPPIAALVQRYRDAKTN
jgi:hypothetical protein